MNIFKRHPFFIRLLHWEYWSFHAVYALIYPIWLLLCVRTRSLFFFNLGNPGIENGGFLMESKYRIYQQLPPGSFPETIRISEGDSIESLIHRFEQSGWTYPIIAKPDIGMRGLAVKKLDSADDLLFYHRHSTVDYLLQQFVNYPMEAGIFYCRFPNEEKGTLTGIVYKEVLSVTGDGVHNIRYLLQQSPRYRLQLPFLEKDQHDALNSIPPAGEKWTLPYGNHARGALFLDASDRIDEALTAVMDQYCRQIPGFFYGRLDIRFQSWEELRQGQHFSVIELNGSGSEPTHMYDPRHSLFFAWKEIVHHWFLLNRISRQNRRITGLPYMSFREGRALFKANGNYLKKLQASRLVTGE